MYYQFPKITLPGDVQDVARKVIEEASELIDAIENNEGPDRELEEFCDLWQAFETLHRRVSAKYGPLAVLSAADMVERKNSAPDRRYYD